MPSRTYSHAFLHFLSLTLLSLCCLLLICHIACGTPPIPSNNGQYGTPNLPNAISNHIDWNIMRRQTTLSGKSVKIVANVSGKLDIYINNPRNKANLKALYTVDKSARESGYVVLEELSKVLDSIQSTSPPDQYRSLYAGIEIRGGNGRTDYTVPELNYSNEWVGYEIGTDFVAEASNQSHFSSFGLSGRYEVTDQGRTLTKEVHDNTQAVADIRRELSNIKKAVGILLAGKAANAQVGQDDNNLSILLHFPVAFDTSSQAANTNRNLRLGPGTFLSNAIVNIDKQVSDLKAKTDHLGDDVVYQSDTPALSVFAGTHLINGSGTVTSEGLSTSKLYHFGKEGDPGATILYVVQGVEATLSPGYRHSALQNGIAVIFQDRTPAKNKDYKTQVLADQSPSGKEYTDLMRPPWNVKIGVEYTSPVLGLTKTYTGFVRYRDPSSYADITLAFGEDGTGKNYGSVSIGRSYVF